MKEMFDQEGLLSRKELLDDRELMSLKKVLLRRWEDLSKLTAYSIASWAQQKERAPRRRNIPCLLWPFYTFDRVFANECPLELTKGVERKFSGSPINM